MSMLCDFVLNQDEKTLEIAKAGSVWNKDSLLHIKRDVGVPTVHLEQVDAGDDKEEEEEVNVRSNQRQQTYT